MNKEDIKIDDLQVGRIYSIDYGGTNLIGKFRGTDACNILLYSYLHYWQGFETFYKVGNNYCCKNGIVSIREATTCEKHTLIRKEIENNCI